MLKSKTFKDAENDFVKAQSLEVDEENPGIYNGLGSCYLALKDFERALANMDKAIEKDPENVEFLMNRAQCYFEMGKPKLSIEDLEQAVECDRSDNPLVLYRLGLAYYSVGKVYYRKCIRTLK